MLETLSQAYYHELNIRERIFSRLQFNFAIYASYLALIAYIARMIDFNSNCVVITIFYTGLFFGIILLMCSVRYSYRALTGLSYRLMPSASDVLKHKADCVEHANNLKCYNKTYYTKEIIPDPEVETNNYIEKMYSTCAAFNLKLNEARKIGLKKSLWYMMVSSLPIIFSSILFVAFDLDVSSPRKETPIQDRSTAAQIQQLNKSFQNFHQLIEGLTVMSIEDDSKTTDTPTTPPPPPVAPEGAKYTLSTESYRQPIPSDAEILAENKS